MDVLILAGGRCDAEFAEKTGGEVRGDVSFLGRTLTEIVLDATRGVGRQVVVGTSPDPKVMSVPAGKGFLESLEAGIAEMGDEMVMVTADLPLLRAEHIQTFLQKKGARAEISVPIIELADCQRVAPGVPRTTVQIKEGRFTAGNILWAKTSAMRKLLPKVRQGYENRKSPFKMARIIGAAALAKLVLAKLAPTRVSAKDLAGTVGRQFGIQLEALMMREAEIGTDVDQYSQLEALLALQENGNRANT